MITIWGISGDTLAGLTILAALAISLVLGLVGVRDTGLLAGVGIVANALGGFIFAGGGPGVCFGFVFYPVVCIIVGRIGSGVRYLTTTAREPIAKCEHCRTEIFDKTARVCPVCRRQIKCATCGYDLTGNTSGVCPECGTEVKEPQIDADARR